MRRTRQVIVVALVATALCAGRVAMAAPSQPPVVQMAGRFIDHLSNRFRRVVPSARLYRPVRQDVRLVAPVTAVLTSQVLPPAVAYSPFNFRLPPPLI